MHRVLVEALRPLLARVGATLPAVAEVPVVAAYPGAVVGLSWLTYRFLEPPGQRLGRRPPGG